MKEFLVTLEIITKDYSLQDIEGVLDLDGDYGSYSIGDICGLHDGGICKETVLKLRSRMQKTADIIEHLNDIRSMASEEKVLDIEKIPDNCSILLNIGILFDTLNCSIAISPDYWRWMDENSISLRITCYPCYDSDEDDPDESDD